jgi:hypothetical protein
VNAIGEADKLLPALGVGPALQDQLAERGGSWADRSGLAANALTVQSAYRRWLDGMCSGTVVCRWLLLARR